MHLGRYSHTLWKIGPGLHLPQNLPPNAQHTASEPRNSYSSRARRENQTMPTTINTASAQKAW